ncbi:hypothetical protein L6R50_14430 [Myxococcota bacterium]|nr:hypothetical protein [Myxococcota bacterium]
MTLSIRLESQTLLAELYAILQQLDPARWREDLVPVVREKLAQLSARARALLDSFDGPLSDPRMEAVLLRIRSLAAEIEDAVDRLEGSAGRLRAEWADVRRRLSAGYEEVASSLRPVAVRVPGLRPTNRRRTLMHFGSAILAAVLVHYALNRAGMIAISGALAAWAWTMEWRRRRDPGLNARLMRVFGPVAHPHEWHRVNSATWYTSALLTLALFAPNEAVVVGLVILGVADPAAAVIGRRWGRVRLRANRSLEGSLAFVASGTLAAWATLTVWHPGRGPALDLVVAAAAAIPAAVAELLTTRLDDNLTVPVTAAAGAALAALLVAV